MEEVTPTPVSETPNGADPQQGETPTPQTPSETLVETEPTPAAPSSSEDLTKEVERLRNSLKRANAEAKENRLAAEELKRLKEEAENAKLSETERLQKELTVLQEQRTQELQERFVHTVRQEAAVEAAKLGVETAYLDKIFRFLEWDDIEADDHGKPSNVRELIEQLVKEMPGLLKKSVPVTSGGPTNPPRSATSAPKEISWEMIAKLSPEEYMARSREIQAWMAKHTRR
jgi:hypothetical protein